MAFIYKKIAPCYSTFGTLNLRSLLSSLCPIGLVWKTKI